MNEHMKMLETLLESGKITRFHNKAGIPNQTLAEHQWNVAVMVRRMNRIRSWKDHTILLEAALLHDAAEYETGDIPSPMKTPEVKLAIDPVEKRFNEEHNIPEPNEEIKLRVKIADILEGLRYVMYEGNFSYRSTFDCFSGYGELVKLYRDRMTDTERDYADYLTGCLYAPVTSQHVEN